MSKFKKRALIVISIVVAVIIILTALARSGKTPVANALNTVFSPVQTAAAHVCEPVRNFVTYVSEIKGLHEENERLKSELETLKKESRNSEEYKRENTRLKKLLELTDDLANCQTVPAKVVSCEPGNWFQTLMINKGSRQGIKVSDVVITESGLVGKVTEVGINWARVSTILDSGNAVGVKLTRTGDAGIAEGDAELLKKHRLKIDYISKDATIINGDLLESSGLGGIYPPGLSVGTVEEVELDNTGELVKAVVKPAVELDSLYEVVVVTYWEPAVYDKNQVMIEYGTGKEEKDTGLDSSSLKKDEPTPDEEDIDTTEPGQDDTKRSESTPSPSASASPSPIPDDSEDVTEGTSE